MSEELKTEVEKAVHLYECIGSWWNYKNKIPTEVKQYLAKKYNSTVEEINQIAEKYVEPMYSDCKPQPLSGSSSDMYRFIKDWG